MDAVRSMSLAIAAGEKRQLLLEAGSMVLVTSGEVRIGRAVGWLAEHTTSFKQSLFVEDLWMAESGGWFDIVGNRAARIIVIPAERTPWRQWLGALIRSWFAVVKSLGRRSV